MSSRACVSCSSQSETMVVRAPDQDIVPRSEGGNGDPDKLHRLRWKGNRKKGEISIAGSARPHYTGRGHSRTIPFGDAAVLRPYPQKSVSWSIGDTHVPGGESRP